VSITPNRNEVERIVLDTFRRCPFCKSDDMRFEWGQIVPKKLVCQSCGASWEPAMSYDGFWSMIGAKLVSLDSKSKWTGMLNKLYSPDYWARLVNSTANEEELGQNIKVKTESSEKPEKVVVIREIVKIRCPYCGGLYDEHDNRCPYCGGKR
jgi:DNA-directed RNA polymerase subunit RPC12/RpoP